MHIKIALNAWTRVIMKNETQCVLLCTKLKYRTQCYSYVPYGSETSHYLQQLGAQVTKVEPPFGDPFSYAFPQYYKDVNQDQKIIKLDLKNQQEKDQFFKLLSDADLLIASSRPAALERLGISYKQIHDQFPKLCYLLIVGYPNPKQNEAGHDVTYQAELGMLPPPHYLPSLALADMAGAQAAQIAAVTLLYSQLQTKIGNYQEVSLQDAVKYIVKPCQYTPVAQESDDRLLVYNVHQTDGLIAVAALETQFRQRLTKYMGDFNLETWKARFMEKTAKEWHEWGVANDVPIVQVLTK